MSRPSDRDLMQLYDGELSPNEEDSIAKLLAEDPDRQRILGGLELVGEAVRAWADAKSGPADGVADRVMAAVATADAPRRLRRRRVVATVAGALAMAAGIALAIGLGSHDGAPGRTEPASAENDSLLSADIEAVDFGGQSGSIFLVQADNDGPTPVVWLEDPDTETL